jgi:hypothetical protein
MKRYAGIAREKGNLVRNEARRLRLEYIERAEKVRKGDVFQSLQSSVESFCGRIRREMFEDQLEMEKVFKQTERVGMKLDRIAKRMRGTLRV